MNKTVKYSFQILCITAILYGAFSYTQAKSFFYPLNYFEVPDGDTNKQNKKDSLKFPIEDRDKNKLEDENNKQFDLKDPSNLETEYEYDPETKTYQVKEKIGSTYYRNPSYLTLDKYQKKQAEKDEDAYWRKRADQLFNITKAGGVIPKVELGNRIFDRIFGGTTIEVKPQGNVDLFFGGNWQNVKNPSIVQSAQKYGIFDFDVQMNLNLMAKVGDKMRMNFNYNTKATFDFENQLKLEHTGKEDEIIRKIEAGYISFPLQSSLIQGVQSLFGVKAQLQFGRLTMTNVLSQQKSKKESFQIKSGAQTQNFSISGDDYDYFRHFLLSQRFKENFNGAMAQFPVIQSLDNITRIEVWITNRQGTTTNARDVVALQDLGESQPFSPTVIGKPGAMTDNQANDLYSNLIKKPGVREIGTVVTSLQSLGLRQTADFEKTFARQLNPNEFNFNPSLGFISVNTQLQPDDVIGVAYEYTNNGKVYQVGEFSQSLPPDSNAPKVLFLKMLKSTSPDPTKPIWDLMMKNVYSLGASGVSPDKFILNILYLDPGGGEKRYLPEGPKAGIPLLNLLNLDRLNNQNDPQPDGRFDFVEGITIQAQQGKIIFPVLEPFGKDLKPLFEGNTALEKKYVYQILYDSTKNIAIQFPQYNRFLLKGSFQSANSSEIFLGGFNIPQNSVSVFAGGQKLIENVDYTIDYGIGKLKILNSGILSSGIPINVTYENNVTFGTQMQNFLGTRLDYFINNDFSIGSTILRLSERPYANKVSFGDDPIKNTVVGLDARYQKEMPGLTRLIDKLPIIKTTANSMLNASGEVARIFPGHSRLIAGTSGQGEVYIDDFEGSRSSYDLKFPIIGWSLASTPLGAKDASGNILFPEASLVDNLDYGKNRARMSWYNIDPCMVDPRQACTPKHLSADTSQLSNHYLRLISQQEVFPNRSQTSLQGNLVTMDLAYFPMLRGPYNYDAINIDANGNLLNPEKRWAGIMRPIDFSDFETANVEFIEVWLMDPFIEKPNMKTGSLYFNLGNVSEDILKDSRKFFENGLPAQPDPSKVSTTNWGNIPKFQQQVTTAFGSDPAERVNQDVGFDGMNDAEEKTHFANFLNELATNFGSSSKAYLDAQADPSGDDYHHFRGDDYDNASLNVLGRYMKYCNPEGNSPAQVNSGNFTNAFTNVPESEDINRDNTLNENESYYEYRIDIKPNMNVGENFIVSKQIAQVNNLPNGASEYVTWYQFKIPIGKYTNKVGSISDFRSIRFFRMFMNGFNDTTVLRLARLDLGRNQWRRYNFSLKNPGEMVPLSDNDATFFNLNSVSLEENGSRSPIPYVIPPGIVRNPVLASTSQIIYQNEQALSLQTCGLEDGDSRGVFKSIGMDLRQYKKLDMFIHAESMENTPLKDNDVSAFVRLGSDFSGNYYEYQIPLKLTQPTGLLTPDMIWPKENNLQLNLQDLVDAKAERNRLGHSNAIPYIKDLPDGRKIVVVGNPNLGDAKSCMMGVLNPKKTPNTPNDDGAKKCVEVWFNELRLADLSEQGGYAATGQATLQLADLGNVKASGNMYTAGYGNIDQKVNERARENFSQLDISTTINAGKILPENWGVQLPVFAGLSQTITNPIYDPYDLDVKLKDKLQGVSNSKKDSIKKAAQDATTVKSLNFQNVRINPKNDKVNQPWDLKNFDASYAYTQTYKHDPLLEKDVLDEHNLQFGYTYAPKAEPIEPFKKLINQKHKYLTPIRDFNIGLIPSNFTFRNSIQRIIGETAIRNIDEGPYTLPVNYFKFFTWSRTYTLRWNFTRSLSLDYNATNLSRIDEPYGRIDSKEKRDTVIQNLLSGGRNTLFNQSVNANYTLPLNKFPLTDWMNIRAGFGATYNFTRASLLANNLGNTLGNTQTRSINADFNFTQLYSKVKLLRVLNNPYVPGANPKGDEKKDNGVKPRSGKLQEIGMDRNGKIPQKDPRQNDGTAKDDKTIDKEDDIIQDDGKTKIVQSGKGDADRGDLALQKAEKKKQEEEKKKKEALAKKKKREERKKRMPNPPEGVRIVGRVLMGLKRVALTYNENMGTILPGYLDSNQYVGMNFANQLKPGADFVFGYQPTRAWLNNAGQNNWLTRDSIFNSQLQQNYSQTYNITANVEPFRDFRIDLTLKSNFSKNLSELFKDTIGGGDEFIHLNPYQTGSFDISYVTVKTLFQKEDKNDLTEAFYNFEKYRQNISKRLGIINPYTNGLAAPEDKSYSKGYTRYQQSVLIPAFLAAYAGKDPEKIALLNYEENNVRSNPFKYIIPIPNWRINYNGLARNKKLKNYFQSFTLTHAYTGNLSMNGFNSALMYQDRYGLGYPSFIDSITGNYIPYFFVPNITMNENFGPIIGIDATLQNSLNIHFDWKKSRMLSMSLIDFQLSETKSSEFSFGGGIRLKNVTINTQYFNLHNQKSDVNIKMDFSIRDDKTLINRLDQRISTPTRGQKVISISPSVDYLLNKNLTIRFLYDRRQSIPYVSNSYPITSTRGGVMFRFLLGQ